MPPADLESSSHGELLQRTSLQGRDRRAGTKSLVRLKTPAPPRLAPFDVKAEYADLYPALIGVSPTGLLFLVALCLGPLEGGLGGFFLGFWFALSSR